MSAKLNLHLPALLEQRYLYNHESHLGEYVAGEVVSMTAHPGKRPTFDFLVAGKGLFCDLPIYAFHTRRPAHPELGHSDAERQIDEDALNLEHCPEQVEAVYAFTYEALLEATCSVFQRGTAQVLTHEARYKTSVEFPHGNALWHIIEVAGRLGLVANQLMLVGPHTSRPDSKRLERDYSAL